MRSGAKKAVVWTCGLGVLVLVVATIASWDALAERYWLWKLESGDAEAALAAAQELSRRHTVRSVRPFVERIRATSTEAADGWVDGGRRLMMSPRAAASDVESYTDVYLPPFAFCLHGVGREALTAVEREIATLEQELEGRLADLVQQSTIDRTLRTLHALRCVRRAWCDKGLTVHADKPVRPRITTWTRRL